MQLTNPSRTVVLRVKLMVMLLSLARFAYGTSARGPESSILSFNSWEQKEHASSSLTEMRTPSSFADDERGRIGLLRELEIGDFDQVNEILQDAQLQLVLNETQLGVNGLQITIEDLYCTQINLGDINTNYTVFVNSTTNLETMAYTIRIFPFDMQCFAEYSYNFGFLLQGSGKFETVAKNNEVEMRINLVGPSTSFQEAPPNRAEVQWCQTIVRTDGNIVFEADKATDIVDDAFNLLKQPISTFIDSTAANVVCEQLATLGDTMFAELLNTTDTILTTWLPPLNASWTDPLLAETLFQPSDPDLILLDFQQNNSDTGNINIFGNESIASVADLFAQILDRANNYLSKVQTDKETGNEDLGVNLFLQNYVLDDNGALDLNMTEVVSDALLLLDTEDAISKTQIRVNGVRLTGLDTLTSFDAFVPVGQHTLGNKFAWERLSAQVGLTVDIEPSSLEDSILYIPSPVKITEDITIAIDFTDVNLLLSIFVPINEDKFDSLTLGTLLDPIGSLPCFLSVVEDLEVSGLDVTIGDMTPPTLEGFSSPGLDRVLSNFVEAIFVAYQPTLLRAVPGIFQGPARSALNDLFSDKNSTCEDSRQDDSEGAYIDLRDLLLPPAEALALGGTGQAPYGTIVGSVFAFLKRSFFAEDPSAPGLSTVNTKLISQLAESQSGNPSRFFFPGSLFNVDQNVDVGGFKAGIQLDASDFFINNIDTLGAPLTLLQPASGEAHLLNNDATLGLGRPLEIGFKLFMGLFGDDAENIENDMAVTLSMDALRLLLDVFLLVSEESLMKFPIRDIGNLQCWLASIPAPELDPHGVAKEGQLTSVAIDYFAAVVQTVGLKIDCIDCSGPKIIELSSLLTEQSSNGMSPDFTDTVNGVFELATELVSGPVFRVLADRALNDARKRCPHSPDYDSNFAAVDYAPFAVEDENDSVSFFVALITTGVLLFVIVLIAVFTAKLVVRRRHRKWLTLIPRSQVRALYKQQQADDAKQAEINETTNSMFRSEIIPRWVRLFMPIIILGNIGFFLSGHLSLGASVTILVSIGGQSVRTDDFYEFSMATSTIDLWNAGGEALAILIFLFSFIWPYSKQIITLLLWFAPTSRVSVQTRGSVLLWLDALAKWSIIDIFTLVVTIVVFRVSIQSPNLDFLPEDLYSIDLLVIPKWGLYANMIAQLISQLSSHYIIHYHRRIVRQSTGEDVALAIPRVPQPFDHEDNDFGVQERPSRVVKATADDSGATTTYEPKDRLCDHAFRRPHRGETDKLVARRLVSPVLGLTAAILSSLVVIGCVLPTYSIDALGIIGVLIESGQAFVAADTEYSVITTMKVFFDQAKLTGTAKDYIGLGSLTILVVLTVLVVPVVQAGFLLVHWFAPLTKKRRFRLSIVLEMLQAWQYAEVYLLALLVGSWQLGPLSEFIINPYCKSLEGIFAELVYYGVLKDEDAQCFKADVNIEPVFFVLLVGTLLLAFVNAFIMKAVAHYFRDVDGKTNLCSPAQLSDPSALEAQDDDEAESNKLMDDGTIHRVQVLFTDSFRWFLRREDTVPPPLTSGFFSNSIRKMETTMQGSMPNVSRVSTFDVTKAGDDDGTRRGESSSDENLAVSDKNEDDVQDLPDMPKSEDRVLSSEDEEHERSNASLEI